MTFTQGLILGVVFLVIALAGSAGITYGIVELSGTEGPQGEQGAQGSKGAKGARGSTGSSGSSAGLIEVETSLRLLASLWAVDQTGESTAHPQNKACVDYIMDFEGSGADCGFVLVE